MDVLLYLPSVYESYGARSFNPNNPDNAYSSVVGIFEHRFKSGKTLQVTGNGDQRRDFVDVRDVALANIEAALVVYDMAFQR